MPRRTSAPWPPRDSVVPRRPRRARAAQLQPPSPAPSAEPQEPRAPSARWLRSPLGAGHGQAALAWRDAHLPLLGQLRATAWLPTILFAACLVALVYLMQTSAVATTGYDIQRLQAERDDWQLRNEQLQLELSKRQSLAWVASEATSRLGMVTPQPTSVVFVQSDH